MCRAVQIEAYSTGSTLRITSFQEVSRISARFLSFGPTSKLAHSPSGVSAADIARMIRSIPGSDAGQSQRGVLVCYNEWPGAGREEEFGHGIRSKPRQLRLTAEVSVTDLSSAGTSSWMLRQCGSPTDLGERHCHRGPDAVPNVLSFRG